MSGYIEKLLQRTTGEFSSNAVTPIVRHRWERDPVENREWSGEIEHDAFFEMGTESVMPNKPVTTASASKDKTQKKVTQTRSNSFSGEQIEKDGGQTLQQLSGQSPDLSYQHLVQKVNPPREYTSNDISVAKDDKVSIAPKKQSAAQQKQFEGVAPNNTDPLKNKVFLECTKKRDRLTKTRVRPKAQRQEIKEKQTPELTRNPDTQAPKLMKPNNVKAEEQQGSSDKKNPDLKNAVVLQPTLNRNPYLPQVKEKQAQTPKVVIGKLTVEVVNPPTEETQQIPEPERSVVRTQEPKRSVQPSSMRRFGLGQM